MIRVLHSVSNMDRAGIETMIMNYYRHMDREQIQFDFWANKPKPGAYESEIEAMGGHIYRSPGYARYGAYAKALGDTLRGDPALRILHVHNGALGVYALRAAKQAGLPNRVYHAHATRLPRDKIMPYKWLCKQFINRYATARLACGADSARFYYGRRVFARGEYQLIRNAVELPRFRYDPALRARMREERGLEGRFVVAHVGRMTYQKNHDRLLDIFAEIRKLEPTALLLLLGDGELMDALRDKAGRLGLEVRMPGNVPDVHEWYQAMDAFVMPSRWEGLPVVGVEAQAAGLPCFFSTGITPEAKVCDNAWFIDLAQSDAFWAEEIVRRTRETARGDTGAALREAGYDIELEAAKLQRLYLSLAGE